MKEQITKDPLTIVCWKWDHPLYHVVFTADHVNTWAAMIKRNLTLPHRLLCITDDPAGIQIETFPLWDEFNGMNNPKWSPDYHPQCYRRIKTFDPAMKNVLGDRFVSMDLDCVISGNLDEMLSRQEDFIICEIPGQRRYGGCMWMMDTGCRPQVYESFNQEAVTRAARWPGSDQAWILECLGPDEATFGTRDGVYSFQSTKKRLPIDGQKIVFFNGRENPWDDLIRKQHRFVREHYRL